MENIEPNGIHHLVEFFGCDAKQIDDIDFWKKALRESINNTSIENLHDFFFKFEPQGVTGFLLLSSSHIAVHTWPEKKYVVCDVFTCSTESETDQIMECIKKSIKYERIEVKKIKRGFKVSRNNGKIIGENECSFEKYKMDVPVFSTGKMMKIDVIQDLVEIETAFQKIKIVLTKDFGKYLIIDGIMQLSEKDHYLYDREMIKKLKPTDQNILILGGGDGYVAARLIAENPSTKINVDVVDLDVEVIKACERYFGQDVFRNKQVHLHIGDALHFLKTTKNKYDGIICDLTDNPIGTKKEVAGFNDFFEKVISFSKEALNNDGWIGVQGGASKVTKDFINEVEVVRNVLEKNKFKNISQSDVYIPSYGEDSAFLFAEK